MLHHFSLPETLAHIGEVAATVAAAGWFFFTASFKKRIEFSVDCSSFSDHADTRERLVELVFKLENKGQVENRCYTLAYEVQEVSTSERKSATILKRSGNLVPTDAEYYYVRAAVAIRITARVWIPSEVSIIRVKAFTLHDRQRH